tara:strand:+ start:539 stop:832 length:294 start_codon:yes stop_codon:yes gene_type:complete
MITKVAIGCRAILLVLVITVLLLINILSRMTGELSSVYMRTVHLEELVAEMNEGQWRKTPEMTWFASELRNGNEFLYVPDPKGSPLQGDIARNKFIE